MGVEDVALASMHSISKGFYGECGRRGGYTEFVGFGKDVLAELYKLASINLCSNVNGQICTALMMQPPKARARAAAPAPAMRRLCGGARRHAGLFAVMQSGRRSACRRASQGRDAGLARRQAGRGAA